MSVHINFVCNHEFCRVIQQVGFDNLDETWGDMVVHLEKAGWTITEKNNSMQAKVFCPLHSLATTEKVE